MLPRIRTGLVVLPLLIIGAFAALALAEVPAPVSGSDPGPGPEAAPDSGSVPARRRLMLLRWRTAIRSASTMDTPTYTAISPVCRFSRARAPRIMPMRSAMRSNMRSPTSRKSRVWLRI